jgi:hypothetical protein
MKLIDSYLSHRKVRVSVEGELSTPKEIEVEVPQGPVLAPTLYSLHTNYTPPNPRGPTSPLCRWQVYICNRTQAGIVPRKLQRGLTAMELWRERWNIKINEDKTRSIYFCHIRGPVGIHLTLKGRNNRFVKEMKYLGVIFYSRITWRQHTDSIVTQALQTFIRIYPLLKSERLSAKSKLTLYEALMRSKMTYACPA